MLDPREQEQEQDEASEAAGWQEQPPPAFLIRNSCIISLLSSLQSPASSLSRITYTGGCVLPGATPGPGQTPLPADLEQTAYWFQTREKLGLRTSWPSGGEYKIFVTLDLLPSVQATLTRYTRLLIL